jgi:hypothetical protein
MRHLLLVLPIVIGSALFAGVVPAQAAISIGINIGVNMPLYPRLVLIPGYPVYYDPAADANYFFYDGLYWVLNDDRWYSSTWYDGPWDEIDEYDVPVYLLRVPVRYYVRPPVYFQGWRRDAPPRWDEHWGPQWHERRHDWDRWNRQAVPRPAPLPAYQRNYSGGHYPRAPQQQNVIRGEHYRYTPHEQTTRRVQQEIVQPGARQGRGQAHDAQRREPDRIDSAPQIQPGHESDRRPPMRPETPPQDRHDQDRSDQGRRDQGRSDQNRASSNPGERPDRPPAMPEPARHERPSVPHADAPRPQAPRPDASRPEPHGQGNPGAAHPGQGRQDPAQDPGGRGKPAPGTDDRGHGNGRDHGQDNGHERDHQN